VKRIIIVLGLVVALAAVGATGANAVTWRTVGTKKVSGFNVAAFSRTINHLNGMRLRASSNGGSSADWTVACSEGFSIRSKSGTWRPASGIRTHVIPKLFTGSPDSCEVVVAVSTSGGGHHATYQLQKH
jgi:hypothetical protein